MDVSSRRALGSRYELVERLDGGAMGEVWRTLDLTSGEHVAAKLLRPELTTEPDIVARFIQERSILMGLDHPALVKVRDLVVEGDRLAIVMDLVDGGDLRRHLAAAGTLPAADAVPIAARILDALAVAHAAHCLHRDVKPANVLLAKGEGAVAGRVLLTDFGIARLAQDSTVDATGLLGTPSYMPPELFEEGRFSGASDVYAVGITLYELLAGRTPFAGPGTAHTIGNRHVRSAPPPLPLPAPLWQLVASMLAKDPSVRLNPEQAASALRELPVDVLAAPPLSVQPTPVSWPDAPAVSRNASARVHVQEPVTGVDVGATNLHGDAVLAPRQLATTGEVEALSPELSLLGGEATNLLAPGGPTKPVLEPAVELVHGSKNRRPWWWWTLGAATAVLILAGGYALTMGTTPRDRATKDASSTSVEPGAGGDIDAVLSDDWASGLRVDGRVMYDPEDRQITLDLTYHAGKVPLGGEVFQALPLGGDCGDVRWNDESIMPNVPGSTSVQAGCGFLIPIEIPAGGVSTFTAIVDHEFKASEAEARLQDWAREATEVTRDALEDPAITEPYYFAQRLDGITVDVLPTQTVYFHGPGAEAGPTIVVRPLWVSGREGARDEVMYSTDVRETDSGAIKEAAGGLFRIQPVQCRNITFDKDGTSQIRTWGDCLFEVSVGDFPTAPGTIIVQPEPS
ncbi:serine/threonine protein kinase [Nocardioides humilatus]|uniref:non-specific serine/threonine protein kinase n=1 Tax=Nocardioides humilatus TaxID=2607660 RepID=A0A5B1LNQ8_9ACTN|nr:serine/threonine-protein kinase [Nocardioides humilatus]KAA1421748.1 serine/threonine protein kinase [Nocardioides humilatus]